MGENDKKEAAELREKLNQKMVNTGNRFTSVKKVNEGQYQLLLSVDSNHRDMFFVDSKKSRFVRSLKPERGSMLEKLSLEAERSSLQKRLDNAFLKDQLKNPGKDVARLDTRHRDVLSNDYVDNRDRYIDELKANQVYSRSEKEYYRTGIYGSTIDLLTNLTATGFYNEINDPIIKEYYDSWVNDVNFIYVVKKIIHSLYKCSVCYILKAHGTYEPHQEGISSIPGREPKSSSEVGLKANVAFALNEVLKQLLGTEMSFEKFDKVYKETSSKNKISSLTTHPLHYAVLDPRYISVKSSGFFEGATVTILPKGLDNLRDMLKSEQDLSKDTKQAIKHLPPGLRKAAESNEPYTFKDDEISIIYLRKDDYQEYAFPKGARAFDSFDYKDELKKADFATVDGIYNFILKVTIGDKDNPVTDDKVLEELAEAFDTPQKAFAIVWNHTLQIEKITNKDVGSILGKAKYEPVDTDISAALGVARALIDGGSISKDAATLAAKATQSEIVNVRQQIEDWIYDEYRVIARAAGFKTYPVVRWKQTVVTTDGDAVTRASFMQMLDRKGISIQTYMREMGFDYETEKQRMEEELDLIKQGILQSGSPFQKPGGTTEDVLKPSPDSGRPKGQPSELKEEIDENEVVKRKTKVKSPSQQQGSKEDKTIENLDTCVKNVVDLFLTIDDDTRQQILNKLNKNLKPE